MIASITSTTTTTTTAATSATMAFSQAAVLGAIGVVALIALLIAKELLSASENEKAIQLGRITAMAINPLLFTFLTIVIFKVLDVL
jgi:Trk-type K+ transport system membrane component